MLIVCRPDLSEEDFRRLEQSLVPLPFALRWTRRAGRLVLLLERASADREEVRAVAADPAVEYALRDPSEDEIRRFFSRRDLLKFSMATTGLIVGAAVVAPVGMFLTADPATRPRRGEVYVGRVEDLRVDDSRIYDLEGEEYLLLRRDEENFHAVSATCTHSNVCEVGWDKQRKQLVCPCHKGIFDVYGNVVSGPPPRPLRTLDVVVRDGGIYVRGVGR